MEQQEVKGFSARGSDNSVDKKREKGMKAFRGAVIERKCFIDGSEGIAIYYVNFFFEMGMCVTADSM